MSKSDVVAVTPLVGGGSSDGVCSLLELGDRRILLDCGCSITDRYSDLLSTVGRLNGLLRGNRLDAILISHADIHHIGLLPMLFRANNGLSADALLTTKIICTTPIYKFGQLVLYDFLLNKLMEGSADPPTYEFDDIDKAFHRVTKAKFNQDISIVDDKAVADNSIAITNSAESSPIVVSALRSGRTIGGSMWRIRSGPTEILYMMDINLKKELVLDGVNINQLPPSPALVVLDGSCVGRGMNMLPSSGHALNEGGARRSRREKDESQALLTFLLQKMRGGSNVLIPCETAGRSLELLQLLGKFWFEQKLGLYHLVFLSHMATNVPEFARTQLEWMSDSLSRSFYNGKPNPFELPQVHWVSSVRQMDRVVPNGPKVVLATDSCLSSGLSKELLLSWGGDPRCCVVFVDQADTGSLAADLKAKYSSPPVIATITKPIRVELAGAELESHRAEQERRRRIKEESFHRKRRQQELTKFNVRDEIELVDDEDDAAAAVQLGDGGRPSSRWATKPNSSSTVHQQQQQQPLQVAALQKKESDALDNRRRKKTKTGDLLFRRMMSLEPNFVMFESEDWQLPMDEYGASIADLPLKDLHSQDVKWLSKDAAAPVSTSTGMTGPTAAAAKKAGVDSSSSSGDDDDESDPSLSRHFTDLSLIPTKLSQVTMRVQFTCEFREFNLSGRADFKAMKAVTSKITPARILVLRGSDSDCSTFLSYAQSIGVEAAYAPKNSARVSFQVYTERLKLHVSQSLLPCAMKVIKSFSSANASSTAGGGGGLGGGGGGLSSSITDGLVDSKCSITSLSRGCVEEVRSSGSNQQDMGTRVLRYKGPDIAPSIDSMNAVATSSATAMSSDEVKDASYDEDAVRGEDGIASEELLLLQVDNPIIGVVSVGEVQLNSLRLLIEAVGISVEVRNDVSKGAILICDDQVMIRKVNLNDYVIEGPPVPAYYEARRVLYQQFAFV